MLVSTTRSRHGIGHMRRETTNLIRFFLEDCCPPLIRDIRLLNALLSKMSGMDLEACYALRRNIPTLDAQTLTDFYSRYPRIQEDTDNSAASIEFVIENVEGVSICDVGCGTGALIRSIGLRVPADRLVGVDFMAHPEWKESERIEFVEHDIHALPFRDNEFDTVVCTHTLEHVVAIGRVMDELRRVARRKLIVVVPRERECKYSFNPHFHYFPYEHSFLKTILPLPGQWNLQRIGRDFAHVESYPAS